MYCVLENEVRINKNCKRCIIKKFVYSENEVLDTKVNGSITMPQSYM